jgi:hypothetical protein
MEEFPVQFPPGVAILPVHAFYSKRGQSSSWAGGREARHDRQAGVPDRGATACLLRIGPPSALAISTPDKPNIGPRYGAGPAGATASPGKPISTRIDYRTESVVTSHITSARAQCKSPVSRSSCGIAPTDGAISAIRASEVGP